MSPYLNICCVGVVLYAFGRNTLLGFIKKVCTLWVKVIHVKISIQSNNIRVPL